VARARVAVERARPRVIRSPSQLETSAVVIDATLRPTLLATLPTRGASGALDLLITRAVEQHLVGSSTLPKVGWDRLGGHHLQF
jgi:hypothetical protein